MAGAPRVRSLNIAAPEADARPVLVPGGNKAPAAARKPSPKPLRKTAAEKPPVVAAAKEEAVEGLKKDAPAANLGARKGSSPLTAAAAGADGGARKGPSPLQSPRRTPPRKLHDVPAPAHLNASLSASCSSDASVESLRRGRASGGRTERSWSRPAATKRGKAAGKVAVKDADDAEVIAPVRPEAVQGKRRCAWVTPTSGELLLPDHFLFYLIIIGSKMCAVQNCWLETLILSVSNDVL
jgi:DNA-3-methyladenine glycosylase I